MEAFLTVNGDQISAITDLDLMCEKADKKWAKQTDRQTYRHDARNKGTGEVAELKETHTTSPTDSLSILQMPSTVRNTGPEKQARSRRVQPLGKPSLRGLCCGMNTRLASAWMPHLSRVQDVRSSHCCFCAHHRAWSDQSRFNSAG